MGKKGESGVSDDLLQTLGDFTSKENWDKFFSIRGTDDSFEWYAEWPELRDPLLSQLDDAPSLPPSQASSSERRSNLQLLVPGCGNSRLSEHLYDAGFPGIINIDFSKVVIFDMLRRNLRQRPLMRWRVMDMTCIQFEDETFDAAVDKGGLDALMEPELGPKLGTQYLSEVKRVLKNGGKYICLTLAESHVLALLFSRFRFGWKMSVYAISMKPYSKPGLQTFMIVVEKESSTLVHQILLCCNSLVDHNSEQVSGLYQALEDENQIRRDYSIGSDIIYSLKDLEIGAKGDLMKLSSGRRVQLTLGGQGDSCFCYRAVLLDALEQAHQFTYQYGIFIVPQTRACEWLFFSEEGQWMVVESSNTARLLMVFLDLVHSNVSMDDIQKDLSPLVRPLAPGKNDTGDKIPFMMVGDRIERRDIVHKVTSPLTGPIIVEDVVYENVDIDLKCGELIFRRLIFERTASLVQSEALLKKDSDSLFLNGENEKRKTNSASKSKKRGTRRKNSELSGLLTVHHGYLASSYHTGIISGFMLISSLIETVVSNGDMVKALIIGLGAGVLPMFLHGCMPCLEIEVVELDPIILDIARKYFNFIEDKRLKVHIADGIQFVKEATISAAPETLVGDDGEKWFSGDGDHNASQVKDIGTQKIDVIIIDVDSSDSSSGMTCPASDFLDESFLQVVKCKLSEEGLFVVNLVTRSQAIKDIVVSRMKKVFGHVFCLKLDEDVNEVHFALNSKSSIKEDCLPESSLKLEKLLKLNHPEARQSIIDGTKKIKRLK